MNDNKRKERNDARWKEKGKQRREQYQYECTDFDVSQA